MLIKDALQDEDGIKIKGESITTIRYADHTTILEEKEEDLQRMMDKIHQHCKNYGMNLNLKKTKTMVINKKDAENKVKVKIENEELEQVKEYTYLGSIIEERGRCIKTTNREGKALWKCKDFLRRDITVELKKRLLNCYVKSVVANGSEAWTYTKEIKTD